MRIQVLSLSKSFSGTAVLRDVSFEVARGEIVCLLGPSGCGKTTLLRILAGLEVADTGQVLLDGQPLDDVPAHRRGFGLMFQDYALFPHKDVEANVAFGPRMQGLRPAQVRTAVAEALRLVGLAGYERRRVYDLSGGEQQRVALARSLAAQPCLLMLDEPLGSLDRALREELMVELRAILRRVGVTTIYVTHDQQEAFAVADRILLMNEGRIVQEGAPEAVYRRPASPWVARFLGLTNLIPGQVVASDQPGTVVVDTALGRLPVDEACGLQAGEPAAVVPNGPRQAIALIHPEGARLAADCPQEAGVRLEVTVEECSFRGGHYRLAVRHGSGQELTFELVATSTGAPRPGELVVLSLQAEAISLLPDSLNATGPCGFQAGGTAKHYAASRVS